MSRRRQGRKGCAARAVQGAAWRARALLGSERAPGATSPAAIGCGCGRSTRFLSRNQWQEGSLGRHSPCLWLQAPRHACIPKGQFGMELERKHSLEEHGRALVIGGGERPANNALHLTAGDGTLDAGRR